MTTTNRALSALLACTTALTLAACGSDEVTEAPAASTSSASSSSPSSSSSAEESESSSSSSGASGSSSAADASETSAQSGDLQTVKGAKGTYTMELPEDAEDKGASAEVDLNYSMASSAGVFELQVLVLQPGADINAHLKAACTGGANAVKGNGGKASITYGKSFTFDGVKAVGCELPLTSKLGAPGAAWAYMFDKGGKRYGAVLEVAGKDTTEGAAVRDQIFGSWKWTS